MPAVREIVAEFQGLYGPYTLTEKVLQKIWLRGDFALAAARLADGRRLEVLAPGEWNLLGGPDFRGARLRIDGGAETAADIEVHFRAGDWNAHGHDSDPAYRAVGLHVVLFPSDPSACPSRRIDGVVLPELALLPLLHRGLEEYAADDALEALTARDGWRRFAELAIRPPTELKQLVRDHAADRWRQKLRYARLRIDKLGWSAAAHHTALEILGYRHNRAPMLTVAGRCGLGEWVGGLTADEAYRRGASFWLLRGVRPANHPRVRLEQYARWTVARPDWTQRLRTMTLARPGAVADEGPIGANRRALGVAELRRRFAEDLTGGAVNGTRLETLICDGFVPLLAAESGQDLFPHWFHWFLGDVPQEARTALRRLGLAGGSDRPLCHGCGQGLLGWLLQQRTAASP